MKVLRASEQRFAKLPFLPWARRYLEGLSGYEGPKKLGRNLPFPALHGEPTW